MLVNFAGRSCWIWQGHCLSDSRPQHRPYLLDLGESLSSHLWRPYLLERRAHTESGSEAKETPQEGPRHLLNMSPVVDQDTCEKRRTLVQGIYLNRVYAVPQSLSCGPHQCFTRHGTLQNGHLCGSSNLNPSSAR